MTNYSEKDVISFVSENDVQFIRLAFVDFYGNLKNLAIMPSELEKALSTGIPIDSSLFYGVKDFSHSDIYLVPDSSTLSVLPWRPRAGRVVRFFCHLKNYDGSRFNGDIRAKLKTTADQLALNGYKCTIGTESQFYLFELDENGEPSRKTNDKAGYLDVSPLDHGENIRREICLSLEEMGIHPETSRHLYGNGQNEITFKPSSILSAADNNLNFKTAVRSIASQNGLYASFMPYPLRDQPRSSFLINISINHNSQNIFAVNDGKVSDSGASFIAGILNRFDQITAFLNPTTNSYHRNGLIGEHRYINWAIDRRDAAIRLIKSSASGEKIEIRTADPAANIHFILNLILQAGLEGIENKMTLPEERSEASLIPSSLEEAVKKAKESDFIKKMFSESAYEKNFSRMDSIIQKYNDAKDKAQFEDETYFNFT